MKRIFTESMVRNGNLYQNKRISNLVMNQTIAAKNLKIHPKRVFFVANCCLLWDWEKHTKRIIAVTGTNSF